MDVVRRRFTWDSLYLFLSFVFVAFGQPAWISGFGVLAAALGFALFWRVMLSVPRLKRRFFFAAIWYCFAQAVQLSWMTSLKYMGPFMLAVYLFLILAMGAQFGLLSMLIKRPFTIWKCLGIAGCWVLFEWSRLFFLTGFTWNPVGLFLTDYAALQFASIFGVYGLSFWVIWVNLLGLRALSRKSGKGFAVWGLCALFPYLFGWVYESGVKQIREPVSSLNVALVQTALLPEQKDFFPHRSSAFVPALDQWERVLQFFKDDKKIDLIVMPEASFPNGANDSFYPLEWVRSAWIRLFGIDSVADFPQLQEPYAISYLEKKGLWTVNNSFLAQALANHFNANVILGLDDRDFEAGKKYNAAFHFQPKGLFPARYEKRILVPVGEYVPLRNWKAFSRFLAYQFQIGDSFDAGLEAKVFGTETPIGVSICIEEIYSGLMRELRQKGAQFFVNITNDVWFPNSRLSRQHFHHGRIRAVENGVSMVRACNTGVTGGVDCFGKTLAELPALDDFAGVLHFSVPLDSHWTFFTFWGDWAILSISLFFTAKMLWDRKKRLL